MAWLWLVLGGLAEVGFTTCLRYADGFRAPGWTLGFFASVALSMMMLEIASRSLPMGTAYAVWGGIGALGALLVLAARLFQIRRGHTRGGALDGEQ